jgi:PAS domain S-box-containing protein
MGLELDKRAVTVGLRDEAMRALLEAAPDGILLVDEEGAVEYANAASVELFGYPLERLHGMRVEELVPDRFRQRHVGYRTDYVAAPKSRPMGVGLDLYGRRADGEEFPIELSLSPVPSGGRKLTVAIVRDRSQQKELEQRRLELAESQAVLLEVAPDGILLVDEDGQVEQVNAAAVELFGYERERLVGMRVEELVPDRFRERHVGYRTDYVAAPKSRPMGVGLDLYGRRADGEEFPLEISLSPVATDGRMLTVAIVRDRTQQREMERQRLELAGSQAVEEIVAGLEAIVWEATSPDRESLTFLGGSESALLGYPRETWLQDSFWLSVVHPDDRLAALTFAETAREQNRFEFEYRLIGANGEVRQVRDIVTVARRADGEIEKLRGVIVDITDRRDLETRLAQAQKMEAVGQLAGGIAHDFNNLLTVASGYARRLVRPEVGSDPLSGHRSDLSQIIAATDRAAELTAQLLAFARRGQGEPELIDPNELLRALQPLLRRLLDEDIGFNLHLDERAPVVLINRSDLEQIVINLVLNARDAMPGGGLLELATSELDLQGQEAVTHGVGEGPYLSLRVSDTGIGIPPEFQARIWEPFFTTKEQGKGTGMGLATVYGIVEQAGGFVRLDSTPGAGTTFAVNLPAAPVEPSAAPELEPTLPTVLLVEDEQALRELAETILREEGYLVLTAGDGREALALAERHHGPLELLVTDVVMPNLSGPELAQRLRSLRPDLQVLYMSGYNDGRLVTRGIEQAKVSLLYKPFRPDELLDKVGELVRTKRR